MGIDRTVTFAGKPTPTWPAVRELLRQRGFPVQMRMIDGQLAFPDEEPPPEWTELRVALPQGLVTLRRTGDRVVFVTWGNADLNLRQAWNLLAWAFAEVGGGFIADETGELDAPTFRQRAELPGELQ